MQLRNQHLYYQQRSGALLVIYMWNLDELNKVN